MSASTEFADQNENAANDDVEVVSSPTRPQNVSRHSDRPRTVRRVTRYTLDLDQEQHRFLRLFALQNGVQASLVMRSLLFMLETDINVANRVIDLIFNEDDNSEELTNQ
jgi:hypothetical protein